MPMRRACLGSSIAVLTAVAAVAAEPTDFILVQPGNLPLILTAPHGGSATVPGVPPRTSGIVGRDAHTLELTQEVAARITTVLGAAPYVVAARFARKQIDANRTE